MSRANKSKYLHGHNCANELITRLAQIVTDSGGSIDTVFDQIRNTSNLDNSLGLVLSDYIATPILPDWLQIDWEKKRQFVILGVKAGESIRFRDKPNVECTGFTKTDEMWYEKSNIPVYAANYQIFRLNHKTTCSQWIKFLKVRDLGWPSMAELVNLFRYLPENLQRSLSSVKILNPGSANGSIDLFSVKNSGEMNYQVSNKRGLLYLSADTHMIARRYSL